MDIQSIKNRFGIIGNSPALNYALEVATQVAATDLTVLINGESGVGKENIPRIIHSLSHRKGGWSARHRHGGARSHGGHSAAR